MEKLYFPKTNSDGYVLLLCLLIIMVISITGTTAMRNSTTDVIIAGNERSIKDNLYQGEGVANEGGQCIDNEQDLLVLYSMGWIQEVDGTNTEDWTDAQREKLIALQEAADANSALGADFNWDDLLGDDQAGMGMANTCFGADSEMNTANTTLAKSAFGMGQPGGNAESATSIKEQVGTAKKMYAFKLIGYSEQNVGKKTVEIGILKRLRPLDL